MYHDGQEGALIIIPREDEHLSVFRIKFARYLSRSRRCRPTSSVSGQWVPLRGRDLGCQETLLFVGVDQPQRRLGADRMCAIAACPRSGERWRRPPRQAAGQETRGAVTCFPSSIFLKNRFAARRLLVALGKKSSVLPAESRTRYRYIHLPRTLT